MTEGIRIDFTYPMYEDHMVQNGGFLTLDKRTHACFNYYLLCQKLLERAGKSIEDQNFRMLEGESWMDKPYGQIAKSVAMRYGLESPDEFLKSGIKHLVESEVARQGFPMPDPEYWNVEPGKIVEV